MSRLSGHRRVLPPLWWLPAAGILTVLAVGRILQQGGVIDDSGAPAKVAVEAAIVESLRELAKEHQATMVSIAASPGRPDVYRTEFRTLDSTSALDLVRACEQLREIARTEIVSSQESGEAGYALILLVTARSPNAARGD